MNQPTEDYIAWERIFFKLEESYWLYLDHYMKKYPNLYAFSGVQEFAKTCNNYNFPFQKKKKKMEEKDEKRNFIS